MKIIILAGLFALSATLTAFAQTVTAPAGGAASPQYQVDMGTILKDPHGNPLPDTSGATSKDPTCASCPPLTLGHVVASALFATYPNEQNLDAGQKWARGALAFKVENAGKIALTSEETSLIKRLVGQAYGALIVYQVFPLLDPNAVPPDPQ